MIDIIIYSNISSNGDIYQTHFDALSLETLYKYVLNSCVCRSECCSETNCCLCQCQSNEIQHREAMISLVA